MQVIVQLLPNAAEIWKECLLQIHHTQDLGSTKVLPDFICVQIVYSHCTGLVPSVQGSM